MAGGPRIAFKQIWVLNHEYVQLHEVSVETGAGGIPAYEAIVFIGWEPKLQEYVCLWLDSTAGGGLSAQGFGHAKKSDASIPFIFTLSATEFIRTTFTFNSVMDAWTWRIDDEKDGKIDRFADVKLSRTH